MKSIEVKIEKAKILNDFTIIYKGKTEREGQVVEEIEEIKTSKEDFISKLRYFKTKAYEINHQNEIFIHDIYPNAIFKEFISTLTEDIITLNENNYSILHDLSCKYQYQELRATIEQFCELRPDINNIIDDYSSNNNSDIKEEEEEEIAKHLDICLKNDHMLNFPIENLNRILNSPKRVINDHRLLFNFVKKVFEKWKSNGKNIEDDERERCNIQILFNSLDYSKMSNDELKEFFEKFFEFGGFCGCRGGEMKIKSLINDNERLIEKIEALEARVIKFEQSIEVKFSKQEEESKQKEKELNRRIELQEKNITKYNEEQVNGFKKLEQLIEAKISKQEEESKKKEKELNRRIEMQEKNITKYNLELQKQQKINEEQDNKIKKLEQLIEAKFSKQEEESKKREKELNRRIEMQEKNIMKYNEGRDKQQKIIEEQANKIRKLVKTAKPYTYDYTGRVESVTLNAGSYKLEVWGAEGGKHGNYSDTPGKGGYSVGILTLANPTKIFIHVGESPISENGGWNGGGSGKVYGFNTGAGGGGSTDISLYGEECSSNWNSTNHLYSRIIVAGAGGGSGSNSYPNYYGGYGGGLYGQSSGFGPLENEGTQTRAGTNKEYSNGQGFGVGGSHTGSGSSGGGGGWYGGGASNNSGCYTGGSGGSGYVYNSSTYQNYPSGCKLNSSFYLADSMTIEGDKDMPNPRNQSTEKGHSGHGYARITPL